MAYFLIVRFTRMLLNSDNLTFTRLLLFCHIVSRALCNPNPCLNGGTCSVFESYNETLDYIPVVECRCVVGYEGDNCESEYTICIRKT